MVKFFNFYTIFLIMIYNILTYFFNFNKNTIMDINDYNYKLNESLIAKKPPAIRGTTKLLTYNLKTKKIFHDKYSNLDNYIKPDDLIILNDTKVIPARLIVTKKQSGGQRELILIEQHGQSDDWFAHKVLYKGKLSTADILITKNNVELKVTALLDNGLAIISSPINLLELAYEIGEVPLPPYLHRKATNSDKDRYQTIWAKNSGSVAAPTASLNMTPELIDKLRQRGADISFITLHVGLGTFLPIRTQKIEDHHMHKEYFEINQEVLKKIRSAFKNNHRIIAIGTTVTRTLEYAADEIINNNKSAINGEADIFIYPGYNFKIVNALLTNFHAPKSTVLMLVSAFCGWSVLKKLYQVATDDNYKFLSYGDSMLLYNEA